MKTRILTLAILFLSPAHAAEGRIPVFSAPVTISAPGRYFVSRNLTASGSPVIEITAANVDLDLNGMEIRQTTLTVPAIRVPSASEVRIHGGFVVGGSSGIEAASGRRLVVEGVTVTDADMKGIDVSDVDAVVISGNIVQDIASLPNGRCVGISGASHGIVERNELRRCNIGVFVGSTTAVVVDRNRIEDLPGSGAGSGGIRIFQSSGIVVSENTLSAMPGFGIRMLTGTGCLLRQNVLRGAGVIDIDVNSNSNRIIGNSITGSASFQAALQVFGDRNVIEGNVTNDGSGWGIRLDAAASNNVYKGNFARGNAGAGGCTVVSTADFCDNGGGNSSAGDNFLPAPGM